MACVVIDNGDTDREIALKLFKVLSVGELSGFREQILDVVQANVESLYSRDADDE